MTEQKFEFRDKLESWIDGVVDVFQMYLWTVIQLHVRPDIGMGKLSSEAELKDISRPSIYFVLSYFFMCFLIRDVDFSNPIFSVNIADRLSAIGVLDAAKTIKLETVIVSLFPAIMILVFFVILATTVLRVFGDDLDPALLRRNYCFALGPDIPVILCTGYSKKISDGITSEIGIKAFAYKPMVRADLAKTVRKVLDEAEVFTHES